MVLDWYRIAKGLVGSLEIVFNKPLGDLAVEDITVGCQVPHGNELILDGPVEPFFTWIVGGRFGT